MADSLSSFSPHIKNICGIQVALRCSNDVEEICSKNYLSFSELLRPFSQLTSEGQVLDTAGHLYTVRDVRIRFSEPRPEPTSLGSTEELLDQTVHWSDRNPDLVGVASSGPVMNVGGIDTPSTTPWYDHYCESFHERVPILEHEYYRHFVAVVLVVSSRHSKPIDAFQSLYRSQKEEEKRGATSSYPYWLPSHHLYYYHVLLHDVNEGDKTYAKETFERLKAIYGTATCYFLPINSVDPSLSSAHSTTPEPWSCFLRIPSSSRQSPGTEETDFSFKRFRRKKSKPSSTPSQTPPTNHTPLDTSLAPLGTVADLQENEIKVMIAEEKEEEEETMQSSSAISLASANVEFGDDPLTQLKEGVSVGVATKTYLTLGECMTLEDQNSLRSFVKEFSARLLPHLSAVLRKLNESLQSKRTVTRRMSNFSRGVWWKMIGGGGGGGGGTTGSNLSTKNTDDSNLSVDSVERLMRQVGDIAFLLQNYELAYNMHHTLKRDLQGKDLWIHYAGALEMAALSGQLLGQSRKEIQSYLEEASQIYLKTLKMPVMSLRTSFFLCDLLKERRRYHDLSQQFINMINKESHLQSALCIEQAAHAFLRSGTFPLLRKYSFHLILAGYHFSQAGQKWHAVRVYMQSLSVYKDKGWTTANDFIYYSCGRLLFSLQSLESAHTLLECLLSHESHQDPQKQLSNYRDYIFVKRSLLTQSISQDKLHPQTHPLLSYPMTTVSDSAHLPRLPLPLILPQLTFVTFDNGIICCHDNNIGTEDLFKRFLTDVTSLSLSEIGGVKNSLIVGVYPYDPTRLPELKEGAWSTDEKESILFLNNSTNNTQIPLCPLNELIKVGVVLKNPLAIRLLLRNITLSWKYTPSNNEESSGGCGLLCEVKEFFVLPPSAQKEITIWVLPIHPGTVTIQGLIYNLCVMETDHQLALMEGPSNGDPLFTEGFQGCVDFKCRGLRLNNTKAEKIGVVYSNDNRLTWRVIDPMPRVMMSVEGLDRTLLMGEVTSILLKVTNCSSLPVTNIRFISSLHHVLLKDITITDISQIYSSSDGDTQSVTLPLQSPSFTSPYSLMLSQDVLPPGQSIIVRLLFTVPLLRNELCYDMCLKYEPLESSHDHTNDIMSHRVLKHNKSLKVHPSLRMTASSIHSLSFDEETGLVQVLVSVEVTNFSQTMSSFKLVQLSSASYSWTLHVLDETMKDITLLPGESVIILFKGTRNITSKNTSQSQHLVFTNISLSDKLYNSHQFPANDVLVSSDAYREMSQEKKGNESKLLLTLFWETLTNSVSDVPVMFGQQSLLVSLPTNTPLLQLSSHQLTTPTISPASQYDLVRHALLYPPTQSHDFTSSPLCVVQVGVVLENCISEELHVTIETLYPSEVTIGVRALEPYYQWSGQTKKSLQLLPLSKDTINLYATFSCPGLYCLNSLRIKARLSTTSNRGNRTLQTQRWQVPSYILINSNDCKIDNECLL